MKIKITILAGALAVGSAMLVPNRAAAQAAVPASTISLITFRNQLVQLQNEITATASSLNLVKESGKDEAELAKAAAQLDTRFKSLEALVETVRVDAVTVKARVKDHYDAWSKELTAMQNPSLREKAQERLTRSQKEFDKIIAEAGKTKQEVLPFVSDVKDTVIYLNADLSTAAVKSLSNTIWKLANRSKSVNGSIKDLIEQIDETIKSLPKK